MSNADANTESIYYANDPAAFSNPIRMAYIVPSISLGHIIQANTNNGIQFNATMA